MRPSDTAARLGGDEFVVLLEEITGAEGALSAGRRVLRTIQEPFRLETQVRAITASAGIRLIETSEASQGRVLIRDADRAMYQAKNLGADGPLLHDA